MSGARVLKAGVKRAVAAALGHGISDLLRAALPRIHGPYVRVVYYHDVPRRLARAFEEQLQFLGEHFAPLGAPELSRFLEGTWRPPRPGLALTFDDGLRSHAEVVAPILDALGWPAWFFVPTGFIACPADEQARYAELHRIEWEDAGEARIAMTWEQLAALDRRHTVGCHTVSHCRLTREVSAQRARAEVTGAKETLEARLGHRVGAFAWVGGEEWAYSAVGRRAVEAAHFATVFTTTSAPVHPGDAPDQLHRTHLSPDFPLSLVKLQLSGILDWQYAPRRRRLRRELRSTGEVRGASGA